MSPERPGVPRPLARATAVRQGSALALPVLREAAREAVTRTSLRAVADAVGMSFSGLRSFLDGGVPRMRTVRLLTAWFLRTDAATTALTAGVSEPTPVHVQAAIAVLVAHLPPATRAEAGQQILGFVRSLTDGTSAPRPAWLGDTAE